MQGIGYGLELLAESDYAVLHSGESEAHGARAIIAAGTGLGEGLLVWRDDHYEMLASEGGHADFAPRDDLELDLLRYLMRHMPRVSYETCSQATGWCASTSFCVTAGMARRRVN